MGAPIMAGDNLEILMTRAAVPVLVLDAGIRETHVSIVVGQLMFPRPARNLFGLTVRPAVAVLLAPVALVQEALIVAFELVVEHDSPHPTTLPSQALLGALIGTIDLGVVGQFARLSETSVEGLARLPGAVLALVSTRFEQVSAAVSQDDRAVIRAEERGPYQALSFKVRQTLAGAFAAIVEVAFGDDAKGTHRGEQSAFVAVDLVHAVTFSHRPALAAAAIESRPRLLSSRSSSRGS